MKGRSGGISNKEGVMPKVIQVIFENGVLRPLTKIHMKEHEKLELRIVENDDWQRRFDCIIKKIRKRGLKYRSKEIEHNIALAIKVRRSERCGH